MAQNISQIFGDGSNGELSVASPSLDMPVDSAAVGTSGSKSLTATNVSFAADQLILIIQMRGANAGNWEINKIASYVAGTITTTNPLTNTYVSSGDDRAQVIVIKQYSKATLISTLTGKDWNGVTGGVIVHACLGKYLIDAGGSLILSGGNSGGSGFSGATTGGFRGGDGGQNFSTYFQGEGTTGAQTRSNSANGNGGGGGGNGGTGAGTQGGGGGGGGNAAAGDAGTGNASSPGAAGALFGLANLTVIVPGGGGGGASASNGQASNGGAAGGGIVMIFADEFDSTNGAVTVNGGSCVGDNQGVGGGAGAGGSVFIKARTATLGTNKITATGGTSTLTDFPGGDGSDGRVRVEACSITGDSSPASSKEEGGLDWCSSGAQIF